jgi:hypothetical protein
VTRSDAAAAAAAAAAAKSSSVGADDASDGLRPLLDEKILRVLSMAAWLPGCFIPSRISE